MGCPKIGNRFNVNQRVRERCTHLDHLQNHSLIKANKQTAQSAICVLSLSSQDGNTKEDCLKNKFLPLIRI